MVSLAANFFLILASMASMESLQLTAAQAADCPLDMTWSNLTLIASICSDQADRIRCCRYVNALITVSVARYAKTNGNLGVSPEISDACISSISETLTSNGVPSIANVFCGLGTKLRVSYQCDGRGTVAEMLQSPNFEDVTKDCKMPLSLENSCRRCLNTSLSFLRHLIGGQDNVTLNTCRDAAFVALTNQDDNMSDISIASCYFNVKGLSILQVNSSRPVIQSFAPETSPSPASSPSFAEHVSDIPLKEHHRSFHLTLIPTIGIMITGFTILLLIILILLIRKKSREIKSEDAHTGNSLNASSSAHFWKGQRDEHRKIKHVEMASMPFQKGNNKFSYKETKKATNNFRRIIGTGRFGTVYKAEFDDGSVAAVKQIHNISIQNDKDFSCQIELLGRLHHRHLVTLKGFSFVKYKRFMIYEFMENGSLEDRLHSSGRTPLSWQKRVKIAIDVANALEYLHLYCDPPLSHGDIKSSKILLDSNFVAKVSDFGIAHLARSDGHFFPSKRSDEGSSEYSDPEYLVTREANEQSDIYDYGTLLLELVTGKQEKQCLRNLVEYSQEVMANDYRLVELVDPVISGSFDLEQLQVVVGIIKLCTQREGQERPSIKQVLRMFYERLDPLHIGFAKAVEEEEGYYGGRTMWAGKQQDKEVIAFSGDARCLQSSSSTTQSYCSRSMLLESSPPQSPHGISLV